MQPVMLYSASNDDQHQDAASLLPHESLHGQPDLQVVMASDNDVSSGSMRSLDQSYYRPSTSNDALSLMDLQPIEGDKHMESEGMSFDGLLFDSQTPHPALPSSNLAETSALRREHTAGPSMPNGPISNTASQSGATSNYDMMSPTQYFDFDMSGIMSGQQDSNVAGNTSPSFHGSDQRDLRMPGVAASLHGTSYGSDTHSAPNDNAQHMLDAIQATLLQQQLEHIHVRSPAIFATQRQRDSGPARMTVPEIYPGGYGTGEQTRRGQLYDLIHSAELITPDNSSEMTAQRHDERVSPVEQTFRPSANVMRNEFTPLLSPAVTSINESARCSPVFRKLPGGLRDQGQDEQDSTQTQIAAILKQQNDIQRQLSHLQKQQQTQASASSSSSPYIGPLKQHDPISGSSSNAVGTPVMSSSRAFDVTESFTPLISPTMDSFAWLNAFSRSQEQQSWQHGATSMPSALPSPALIAYNPSDPMHSGTHGPYVGANMSTYETRPSGQHATPQQDGNNQFNDYLANLSSFLDNSYQTSPQDTFDHAGPNWVLPPQSVSNGSIQNDPTHTQHRARGSRDVRMPAPGPHRSNPPGAKTRPSPMLRPTSKNPRTSSGPYPHASVPPSPLVAAHSISISNQYLDEASLRESIGTSSLPAGISSEPMFAEGSGSLSPVDLARGAALTTLGNKSNSLKSTNLAPVTPASLMQLKKPRPYATAPLTTPPSPNIHLPSSNGYNGTIPPPARSSPLALRRTQRDFINDVLPASHLDSQDTSSRGSPSDLEGSSLPQSAGLGERSAGGVSHAVQQSMRALKVTARSLEQPRGSCPAPITRPRSFIRPGKPLVKKDEDTGNVPPEMRKSSHKVAEQRRRDSLKSSFDDLRLLLPPINVDAIDSESGEPIPGSSAPRLLPKNSVVPDDNPNKGVSKVALLKFSNDYIGRLHSKILRRENYIDLLKAAVVSSRTRDDPELNVAIDDLLAYAFEDEDEEEEMPERAIDDSGSKGKGRDRTNESVEGMSEVTEALIGEKGPRGRTSAVEHSGLAVKTNGGKFTKSRPSVRTAGKHKIPRPGTTRSSAKIETGGDGPIVAEAEYEADEAML